MFFQYFDNVNKNMSNTTFYYEQLEKIIICYQFWRESEFIKCWRTLINSITKVSHKYLPTHLEWFFGGGWKKTFKH